MTLSLVADAWGDQAIDQIHRDRLNAALLGEGDAISRSFSAMNPSQKLEFAIVEGLDSETQKSDSQCSPST